MENESTSTWAFLDKSGEIVNVESDPGSSSESSIEFIHDDSVLYERNNRKTSLQPEIEENSQDVAGDLSGVLDVGGAAFEAENVSPIEEECGEKSRGDFTLENISSLNDNAYIIPDSTSPASPSSSDDSSGSVTLLEGRFSDGDSDFELLDQQSSSDSAHLLLAAGVSNTSPAAQRPKFNFKLKKQAVGTSETKPMDDGDADDESSNNIEQGTSPQIAPAAPVDEIPPVTNLGSLSPVQPQSSLPTLVLKRPRMSVTFLMLASLVFGLLLGFTTKYSLGTYSSDQLSEDIEEIQRINEVHLLREENEHMRKYVDSLKWRMNNLQNSNKQQLLDELQQVNQLLKGRLDDLRQQLDQLVVRRDILKATPGVQLPTVSDTAKQNVPADIHQEINEPTSENYPESQTEMTNAVGAASHDDIIQIHSSSEELVPEENLDVSSSQDITDLVSGLDVPLVDIQQNDASISPDEIIKSEKKANDTIAVMQIKMEEEKKRADNFEKLYMQLKKLVDRREADTESSALESVQKVETKKFQESDSESYCSPLDKDCNANMDLLNKDAVLQLITSVIAEIPPQAQQWKEYVSQKFHTMLDSEDQGKYDEKLNVEPQTSSNFQFKKMNAYMNRMLSQVNKAKEDLKTKFEKTLHKIKKEANKFWKKTAPKNEKEMKFKKSKERKQDPKLEDIKDAEVKHRSSQDSSLQLIDENNYSDSIDLIEGSKISQKTKESGELGKELEVIEMKQNKKSKSYRSKSGKVHQHHRSDDSKRHRPHKSSDKETKQKANKSEKEDRKHKHDLIDEKHRPQKSDFDGKKHQSHKLNSKEKKHQHKLDDDNDEKEQRPHKTDNKEKKQKYKHDKFNDDIKKGSHKSEKERKHQYKYDNDEKKDKFGDDIKQVSHKSDNKERKHKYKYDNDKKNKFDDDIKHGSHKSDKERKHRYKDDDKDEFDDDIKYGSQKFNSDKKHRLHKSDENKKKYRTKESNDDVTKKQGYKSTKDEIHGHHRSKDERKHSRQHKSKDNDERDIEKKHFNAKSASHGKIKRQANVYSDDEKSLKHQKNLHKKLNKKYKNDPEVKAQSKDSCDQLAVRLEDSINTISKEKFRRTKSHTILRMSKKLSAFNKQCKHFSSRSMKEWSACQQMWWTLCGQGFLPGPLQSSKCQHYLLPWQILAAASPDGGGKPSCDDCGCRKKAEKLRHSSDSSKEDQQNATNSDPASENDEEEEKVKSGEWYFKPKSVPEENKERDCDENEFECLSEDLWDEHENLNLQDFDQMMKSEFHRFNHHNHVHRRRCKDHNKHSIYCYSLFHPMHKGIKWASAYYQNMMNLLQNWQRQHF